MAADRKPEFFAGKDIKIGIIGCGYVGLPLALRFADVGQRVTGFDTDEKKIALNAGQSYIQHIPADKIQQHVEAKRFDATTDFTRLREMDAVLICVPTPLDERREPDLSYVEKTAQSIAPNLAAQPTDRAGEHDVSGNHRRTGAADSGEGRAEVPDCARARAARMWPRISTWRFRRSAKIPATSNMASAQIPKVVGGINPASGRAAAALYAQIVSKVVPVSSTRAAEMVKLLENIFRCVNIALVNELKQLCLRMGLDIWEVIDSAATKPFGFMPFYPGPGLGGHCIPVDPYYLSWKAREYDFATRFIELAGEINTAMPYHVVDALVSALNTAKKASKARRFCCWAWRTKRMWTTCANRRR